MGLYQFTINRAITSLSLGTIYQSQPQCAIVPMELNRIGVSCDGRLQVTEIIDFGPIREKSNRCYLPRDEETGKIKELPSLKHELEDQDLRTCQGDLLWAENMKAVAKECIGKKFCGLKDLKKLLKPDGECVKKELYLKQDFYLQVSCGKSAE